VSLITLDTLAALREQYPSGTTPHALFLTVGDTLSAAQAYDDFMPVNHPRVILVDTFKDEVEETLRVAREMGPHLQGVRLDTPSERGGVTAGLVSELRQRGAHLSATGWALFHSSSWYMATWRTSSE